jgi:hypothetical protein
MTGWPWIRNGMIDLHTNERRCGFGTDRIHRGMVPLVDGRAKR